MQGCDDKNGVGVLDAAQLSRIEAVHGGFLYQHLYAVGCLLLAHAAGTDVVMVELDEDIELGTKHRRIYVQVKTRSKRIMPSDISGVLERFEDIRKEYASGARKGAASFVIVVNQAPSDRLQQRIDNKELPSDVLFICPRFSCEIPAALPPAWSSINDAVIWCVAQAEKLNYSMLSPESLVWKLAGLAQLHATGARNKKHAFHAKDLPELFEQLVVQLQDFPAPPAFYRSQYQEPPLTSDEKVRIICGLSGAGKTAWAAQEALHCSQLCAYYDVGDLPGPALASTLVRELAAKFAARDPDGLRRILLPGASGCEALKTFDTYLNQQELKLVLVIDNAHRIPVENLSDILNVAQCICFVLLCQPNDSVRQLEAVTGIEREALRGWDIDTVAAAVGDLGGFASAQSYERLRVYTGGLPLYVQSAANIAVREYGGSVDALCAELQKQENIVETAQEIILTRVYQGFDRVVQDSLALFSLSDVGLSRDEVTELLMNSINVSKGGAAAILKKIRATGTVEVFGNQMLKVHDAVRALGLQHLELMEPQVVDKALMTLKELLIVSLQKTRDTSRFSLLTQVFIKLNDVMTLIALSGEELFYEMGINVDIMASLERALISDTLDPAHKFWALDGLVFSELREGCRERLVQRFEAMRALLAEHDFGDREHIAYAIKWILFSAQNGEKREVERLVEQVRSTLPDSEHERIFDYNHASALWMLQEYGEAEVLCWKVIEGYYDLFGIQPQDVIGKNADLLWKIINRPEDAHEHLKHLADALELYAKIFEARGIQSRLIRIHSMKFYNMAGAPESMVRVGQDLADEFVAMTDYEGAKEVMEQYVLPVVNAAGLVSRLVQVRSQYAVIVALCGQISDAEAEMRRLEPYFDGLSHEQRLEFENQSNLIAQIASKASMPSIKQVFGAVGRNDQCPCGSGLKFKKCHGA